MKFPPKNVSRHILAPSAVACDNPHLRASAHLRHAVPVCYRDSHQGLAQARTLARCSRKLKKRTLPRQAQFSFPHFYFLSFQIPDPLPLFHYRAFRLFSKIRRDLLHSSRLYGMERTALIAVTAGDTVGSMFFQCRVVVRRHRIPGNSFNCQSICFFTFSRFVVQPYSPVS